MLGNDTPRIDTACRIYTAVDLEELNSIGVVSRLKKFVRTDETTKRKKMYYKFNSSKHMYILAMYFAEVFDRTDFRHFFS